ncbi:MJ0042-type zinc finger domain-containing protein [Methylobacterium gregans]|uniref:Zinc finger/thioredoxin putative domain-containing protein n=1 Tax=Methylobacterium gregans TaxID=374424 RepID=A0AA37HQV3_9HYPH|nr:zinc-ribbon domain-containing protein [Methylobacterium gregans]MDQ0519926.1 putative Zn finger-like uncharacterized protein [Methylobacterium gregans]GJD79985.1 hypothetical protein NBEOAGPD_3216 [Methylobacterium gregans]GLS53954.1 MJ0042 family finger-like domain protein [Methylobacterium gregans]
MLITCPTCASSYRVETGRVGMEGRSVRCAACRETWFISPAEVLAAHAEELAEAEAAEPSAADWQEASAAVREAVGADVVENVPPEPPKTRRRSSRPRKAGRRGLPRLSPALAAGLVLAAVLPLACLARTAVVQALPQSAALYAGIGLPVNLRGLEIRDVVAFRTPAQDGRAAELVLEGDLVGLARETAPVPPLTVAVLDAAGRVVRSFAVAPPRAALGQGERARFHASLTDPPADGHGLQIRFAAEPSVPKPASATGKSVRP